MVSWQYFFNVFICITNSSYHGSRYKSRYCLEVTQSGGVGTQQEVDGEEQGTQHCGKSSAGTTPEDIFSNASTASIYCKKKNKKNLIYLPNLSKAGMGTFAVYKFQTISDNNFLYCAHLETQLLIFSRFLYIFKERKIFAIFIDFSVCFQLYRFLGVCHLF